MVYNDDDYLLQSIKLHSPSEHTVGGGYFDGEIQLTHFSNATKSTIVISVLLQVSSSVITGNSNQFLDILWQAASYNASNTNISVSGSLALDPYTTLFPSVQSQFHYIGTETTPPCQEVEWFVFETPVSVSVADIEYMREMVTHGSIGSLDSYGNNNRPTASLQGREVGFLPGGAIPSFKPTPFPTKRPSAGPTRAPTVFIHPGPYKVKVKSAMIVACLALSLTGIVLVFVVVWQIYNACMEKDWSYRRVGELETSLPV
jgi:hypothetical protein